MDHWRWVICGLLLGWTGGSIRGEVGLAETDPVPSDPTHVAQADADPIAGQDAVPASTPNPAPRRPAPFRPPADISHRTVDILSEGSRLTGEWFVVADRSEEPLPTLILSHGWGGEAVLLRPDAVTFARSGFRVLTFDYRGWGASDGRVVLLDPAPTKPLAEPFSARVRELRELVDPLDQTTDLLNVIHYIQGEPGCDRDRLGLWGTSYSGGHVVFAAARDPRVRAIVSQVPALDSRAIAHVDTSGQRGGRPDHPHAPEADTEVAKPADEPLPNRAWADGTARARGELGYPPAGVREVGNLKGAPIREKMIHYAPVELASQAPQCAMLFIIAEREELFDNREHGILAFERATGPKELVTIPGITHYGVYLQARRACQQHALRWFQTHLIESP